MFERFQSVPQSQDEKLNGTPVISNLLKLDMWITAPNNSELLAV